MRAPGDAFIAEAIAKKESRQVNEKFFELKNGDIGMVTKAWRQDSAKYVYTITTEDRL